MLRYKNPKATLQKVLLTYQPPPGSVTNPHVQKVLQHLSVCRTAEMGYHLYQCSDYECAELKYQYHSCRDRHCPQCGAIKKDEWIEARMQELLPVKYYHVVFTLPHELNSVILGHRKILFKLLFDASSQTLLSFAKDERYLGATPGIISVLHTWGQQMSFHPHVHCIVSGGGITADNNWVEAKKNEWRFLFPVNAMAIVYRAKFLQALNRLIKTREVIFPEKTDVKQLFNLLYQKNWVIDAQAPFGGPQTVIEYLGRYINKVAISNHRLHSFNEQDNTVTFEYKDYADHDKKKKSTLPVTEFMRRFEQHILPRGFTKIRSYGYLANRNRQKRINEVLKKLKLPLHKGLVKIPIAVRMRELYGIEINQCPCCKQPTLEIVKIFYPRKKADAG